MLLQFYDGGLDLDSNILVLCCRDLGVGFLAFVFHFTPIPTFLRWSLG
jgi:hypothetical protein